MPGFYEVEFYAIFSVRNREVVPQAVATEAEVLKQFIALGASDIFSNMPLTGLQRMDTFEILSPRMAMNGVISLPKLVVFIRKGITTTIDSI